MTFYLLLGALESIIDNRFYDIELRIGDVISVLLSISLQDSYHEQSTEESIVSLKLRNAQIMGKLLNQNRTELKRDCANILLRNIFDTAGKVK